MILRSLWLRPTLAKVLVSMPAQNPGPLPESTTARRPASWRRRSPASATAWNISWESALYLSGRSSRTSATPSWISIVTPSPMLGS